MATEAKPIRDKTRRVKNHILDVYIRLSDRVSEKGEGDLSEKEAARYWELTTIFAKNVVPRTQEITGEEGEAIKLMFDKSFNGTPSETTGDSAVSGQVQDNQSGS